MYKQCSNCDKSEKECQCLDPEFLDFLDESDKTEEKENKTVKIKLIEFAKHNIKKTVVSKSDSSKVYVLIPIKEHVESFDLASTKMKHWLKSSYYDSCHEVFSDETYNSALDLLSAKALTSDATPSEIIYNRVAMLNDEIYYDLCSPGWTAVKVSKNGVEIVNLGTNTPIFSRSIKQTEQVMPNLKGIGDSFEQLIKLLRIDDQKIIFQVHLISLLLEKYAMPIMAITGEQGSIKSTISAAVKRIVDPSGSTIEDNTNKMPKNSDDLNILLYNKYCCVFDNVSYINNDSSDDLCRAVTGNTYQKRKLYTDSDEIILTFKGKIIFNGISPSIEYNDLLDRTIFYHTEQVPKEQRITEEQFNEKFESLLPYVLGDIFNVLFQALKNYPKVKQSIKTLPRLADFATWGECISRALGNKEGQFLEEYEKGIADALTEASYSHAIIPYIAEKMNGIPEIESPVSDFYVDLKEWAESHNYDTSSKFSSFPKAANKLVQHISRINPLLRNSGYEIQNYTNTRDTRFTKNSKILRITKLSSPSSPTSPIQNQAQKNLEFGEDTGEHKEGSEVLSSPNLLQITHKNDSGERSESGEDKSHLLEEQYFTCFTCNERGSGPFRVDTKLANGIVIHNQCQKNNHKVKYLTKQESEDLSQGDTYFS